MNLIELTHALLKLRLGGMAHVLESRLLQAQAEQLAPIDFVSALVSDELVRRGDRLLERRIKQAGFRDHDKTLDAFDFDFNKKMDRQLVFELATGRFVTQREDALFLGPPGTGKSHIAQAIGHAAIQQGHRVLYREAHVLLEELAESRDRRASARSTMELLSTVPLLVIDDLGMRKLPATAAEDLLELMMRRYERDEHAHHVEPTGRGLGQAARRQRRGLGHARPPAPPRGHPQVRPAKLPHEPRRLVRR